MSDITDFFSVFLDFFTDVMSFALDWLGSISIFGVPLLVYIITFFVVGSLIPLVLSLIQKAGYRRYYLDRRQDYYDRRNNRNNGE